LTRERILTPLLFVVLLAAVAVVGASNEKNAKMNEKDAKIEVLNGKVSTYADKLFDAHFSLGAFHRKHLKGPQTKLPRRKENGIDDKLTGAVALVQEMNGFDNFAGVAFPTGGCGGDGGFTCYSHGWKTFTDSKWKCILGNFKGDGHSYIYNSKRHSSSETPECGAGLNADCCKSEVPCTFKAVATANTRCLPAGASGHASDYFNVNIRAITQEQCENGLKAYVAYARHIGETNTFAQAEFRASDAQCWWVRSATDYVPVANTGTTCIKIEATSDSTPVPTPTPTPTPTPPELSAKELEDIQKQCTSHCNSGLTMHDSAKVTNSRDVCHERCSECAKEEHRFTHNLNTTDWKHSSGQPLTQTEIDDEVKAATCTKCYSFEYLKKHGLTGLTLAHHDDLTMRETFQQLDARTGQGSCEVFRWQKDRSEYPGKALCSHLDVQGTEWMECIDEQFQLNSCAVQNLQTLARQTTFFTQTKLCSSRLMVQVEEPSLKGDGGYAFAFCELNKIVDGRLTTREASEGKLPSKKGQGDPDAA